PYIVEVMEIVCENVVVSASVSLTARLGKKIQDKCTIARYGENETRPRVTSADCIRRENQGRLIFLLDYVTLMSYPYAFVKRSPKSIPNVEIDMDLTAMDKISVLLGKLLSKHQLNQPIPPNTYFVNYMTGECSCYDAIWRGPFRDNCKHVKAAR